MVLCDLILAFTCGQKLYHTAKILFSLWSMLGTKMVKEGFVAEGGDVQIGVSTLCRLALDAEFESESGSCFDNDAGHIGLTPRCAGQ